MTITNHGNPVPPASAPAATAGKCPKCGGPTEEWNQPGRVTPAIRCITNGCTWFIDARPAAPTGEEAEVGVIAGYQIEIAKLEHRLTAQATELAALRARVATAKSALENWGQHHSWCEKPHASVGADGGLPSCTCGYEQAIRDASPESFMSKEWCLAAAKDEADAEARAALAPRQTTET